MVTPTEKKINSALCKFFLFPLAIFSQEYKIQKFFSIIDHHNYSPLKPLMFFIRLIQQFHILFVINDLVDVFMKISLH